MILNKQTEKVTFWKSKHLKSMDCLHGTYIHHAFSNHVHCEFAMGVIEDGVEGFTFSPQNQSHHSFFGEGKQK